MLCFIRIFLPFSGEGVEVKWRRVGRGGEGNDETKQRPREGLVLMLTRLR